MLRLFALLLLAQATTFAEDPLIGLWLNPQAKTTLEIQAQEGDTYLVSVPGESSDTFKSLTAKKDGSRLVTTLPSGSQADLAINSGSGHLTFPGLGEFQKLTAAQAAEIQQKAEFVKALASARLFYFATQQMAIDGETTGDKNLGWPADIKAASVVAFTRVLFTNHYLSQQDIDKIATRFLVTNTSDKDPEKTIFLISDNYRPDGAAPGPGPFGPYVVLSFRDGSGTILSLKELSKIGQEYKFPARTPAILPAK